MLALILLVLVGCSNVETGICFGQIDLDMYSPGCVPLAAWQCPEDAEDTSIDSDECIRLQIYNADEYGKYQIRCSEDYVPYWICE